MHDISRLEFDEWREWIKRQREVLKKDWEYIQYGGHGDESGLNEFFHYHVNVEGFRPADITIEDWYAIVNSQKVAEEEQQEIITRTRQSMLVATDVENDAQISTSIGSAWQQYRKHLKEKSGFSENSLAVLEQECYRVLKKLNGDTRNAAPVKGLVIGNVQSGKTASMAGLMAMAADNGWNMFIILSGTIENLREQTETRLYNDLTSEDGNLIWQTLEKGLKKNTRATHGQTKHCQWNSKMRYFTVCLKNKSRLSNLIKWLQADPHIQEKIRILVIDDEADQASINTGDVKKEDEDRKAINKLIVNLVNGKTEKGKNAEGKYLAMNYVCYTATPYANFLNENYEQSLYPNDFLISLEPSRQYIGPSQVFGEDDEDGYDGMNVIREISEIPALQKTSGQLDDMDIIDEIHEMGSLDAPVSFMQSICWFLCAAAAMRYQNYKKPITMLVHTSVKQVHHTNFAEVIDKIINHTDKQALIEKCRFVYSNEIKQFTKTDFLKAYPEYERGMAEIPDYPDFDIIEPEIIRILSNMATAIPLNEEGDELAYHEGIHLCVDNCANNGINDENMYVRLMYPTDENMPEFAPIFIVVGGSTLSRGLTLQGLVCTYFARKVKQADTLMQMGRWFGYRQNYELYQRIWMTANTRDQFEFLTQLDVELRNEIKLFQTLGRKPSDYGPRIKNSPKASFLQITAKKKCRWRLKRVLILQACLLRQLHLQMMKKNLPEI